LYVLEAKNLKKVFKTEGQEVEALKGVNLKVQKGKMVAIMGPSGSGKSTLLHLLGTIDKPTEGKVFIDGEDVYNLPEKKLAKLRNKKIGFVFQFHHLLPEFTAVENVMMPSLLAGEPEKKAKEKAVSLLKRLGLENRLNHKPSQLSGGQQQRVAIARAVINKPIVILADEPTGNLDSENSQKVMEIFKELNKQYSVSIVIATHDEEVAGFCDEIRYMKDGILM